VSFGNRHSAFGNYEAGFMSGEDLKQRTKKFALRILKLTDVLPNTAKGRAISYQLIRAGTSVGANYRAACRARSQAEFVAKLGTVIEEADESLYWMEIIIEDKIIPATKLKALMTETNEIVAIMTASRKTAQNNGEWRTKNGE
jgi:four helix bundle protein